MAYYNPNTKEIKSHAEVCALYHSSFPSGTEKIHDTWYKLYEIDQPAPEEGYNFEQGEIQLVDGQYTRPWNKVPWTPEEQESRAMETATSIINSALIRNFAQTAQFGSGEYQLFATAGLYTDWEAGAQYTKGNRLVCDGVVYEVQQDVLSLENQPPFAEGMLAIYRPISVDPADGSLEYPYTFINGMDVSNGKYYTYNGQLYLAKSDMPACIWPPDTEGLWQWELVNP